MSIQQSCARSSAQEHTLPGLGRGWVRLRDRRAAPADPEGMQQLENGVTQSHPVQGWWDWPSPAPPGLWHPTSALGKPRAELGTHPVPWGWAEPMWGIRSIKIGNYSCTWSFRIVWIYLKCRMSCVLNPSHHNVRALLAVIGSSYSGNLLYFPI